MSEKWYKMSIREQILNIGGEVQRAVDWKDEDSNKSKNFLNKALEWIKLTKEDPKNKYRIEELEDVENELIDFFNQNKFKNNKDTIMDYWNSFLSANL